MLKLSNKVKFQHQYFSAKVLTIFRWFYDKESLNCKKFEWGGCLGNFNRFYTKTKCENKCLKDNSSKEQLLREKQEAIFNADRICSMSIKIGSCGKNETRYYYDIETEACQQFFYSGCKGNLNNFRSMKECLEYCN